MVTEQAICKSEGCVLGEGEGKAWLTKHKLQVRSPGFNPLYWEEGELVPDGNDHTRGSKQHRRERTQSRGKTPAGEPILREFFRQCHDVKGSVGGKQAGSARSSLHRNTLPGRTEMTQSWWPGGRRVQVRAWGPWRTPRGTSCLSLQVTFSSISGVTIPTTELGITHLALTY